MPRVFPRRRTALRAAAAIMTCLAAGVAVPAVARAAPVDAAAAACTITWTGPSAGNWREAANWSPVRVPGATDVVCLSSADSSPTVFVSGTDPDNIVRARVLRTGAATLAVGYAQSVSAGVLDLSGGSTRGAGTVSGNAMVVRAGTTARLSGHQLGAVDSVVSGTIVLSEGSELFDNGTMVLTDGAAVLDGTGRNNELRNGGLLSVRGTARVTASFQQDFDGGSLAVAAGNRLTLARVGDLTDDGSLFGGRYTVAGTLVVPQPIDALIGTTFTVTSTGRLLDRDGRAALRELAFVRGSPEFEPPSPVTLDQDLVDTAVLKLVFDASLTIGGTLTAPHVEVQSGSTLVVDGGVDASGSAPGVEVHSMDRRTISKVVLGRGARVTGGLAVLGAGRVTVAPDADEPPVVLGDLIANRLANTTAVWSNDPAPHPGVQVSGTATLDGGLLLLRHGPPLPTGTAIVVLSADAGVQGTYHDVTVDDPNGQTVQVSYTATQVVATITG